MIYGAVGNAYNDGVSEVSTVPAKLITLTLLFCGVLALMGGLCAVSCAQPTASDRHDWQTYTNVRFNYKLCYPQDLFVPQGESDNSDGQKFLGKDGASLVVYGQNNALNESLKDASDDTASRLAGPSGKITYKVVKLNWSVISGQNGQKLFYAKTLYSHQQFKSFELVYDSSSALVYEPVIRRLNACFADLGR